MEVTGVGDAIYHGERTLAMYVASMGYKPMSYHPGPGWTATTAAGEVLKVDYTDSNFKVYDGSTGAYMSVSTEVMFEFIVSF